MLYTIHTARNHAKMLPLVTQCRHSAGVAHEFEFVIDRCRRVYLKCNSMEYCIMKLNMLPSSVFEFGTLDCLSVQSILS